MEGKHTQFRWFILILLFIATTILYIDRAAFGLIIPELKDVNPELDNLRHGLIGASFLVAYGVFFLVMGRIIDLLGTKRGYLLSIAIWIVAVIGEAFAGTFVGFAFALFILGVGQSGSFPTAVKAIAEWFPQKDRAFAASIFNGGTNVGLILAPLVIGLIRNNTEHWQTAGFLWTIPISLIWVFLWMKYMSKPAESKRVSRLELDYINSGSNLDPIKKAKLRDILPHKGVWVIAVAKLMADPVWYFYLFWAPSYYYVKYGFVNIEQLAVPFASIYFFAWIISVLLGGLSSLFLRRGMDINLGRKLGLLVCAVFVVPIVFVTSISYKNENLDIFLLALAIGGHGGWSANIYSLMSDIFPKKATASIAGFGGFAGALSGAVIVYLVGSLTDSQLPKGTQEEIYQLRGELVEASSEIFIIIGGVYLVALLIMHLILPIFRPVHLDPKHE